MSIIEASKTDEEPEVPQGQDNVQGNSKHRDAFRNLQRELTDEDLKSPGTIRLILRDLDSYEECKEKLDEYKEKYHEKDKSNAILETQLNSQTAFDILYSVMLSLGSALLGLVPSIITENTKMLIIGIIIGVIGLIILLTGIFTRTKRKKK